MPMNRYHVDRHSIFAPYPSPTPARFPVNGPPPPLSLEESDVRQLPFMSGNVRSYCQSRATLFVFTGLDAYVSA